MTEVDEDRPVHLEINVATGAQTSTPITDEEWDELRARQAAAEADAADQAAQDKKLADAVAAHPDPLVQEMAKRLGMV